MKKLILLLLCCALLCGCQPSSPTNPDNQAEGNDTLTGDYSASQDTSATDETAESTEAATDETTESTEAATDETQTVETVTITIHTPEGLETFETEELTMDFLLKKLIELKVLNEDVDVNSYYFEGDTLYIDFNEAFGTQICSYGTYGEMLVVCCTVNTLVENYDVTYVVFTVEGEVLESGHVVYDFPLQYHEIEPQL